MHYHFSSSIYSVKKRFIFFVILLIIGLVVTAYFYIEAPRYFKFSGPKEIVVTSDETNIEFFVSVIKISDLLYLPESGYSLSGRVFDKKCKKELFRLDNYILDDLNSGREVNIKMFFNNNLERGTYTLLVDVWHPDTSWFYEKGNIPLNIALRVE